MKNILKFLLLLVTIKTYAQQTSTAENIYKVEDSVLIKTRDGGVISAMVVQKKNVSEPLPAVLVFTTYDQGINDTFLVRRLVDRGYAGIVAYSRGIKTNLNDYIPYERDGDDVYDVVDWISKQSWCNGKVGMYAGSYTGFVQWSAAKRIHPALKTIVPQVAVMPGFDAPMENNVFLTFTLGWASNVLKYKPLPQNLNNRWYELGTSLRSMDSLAGQSNRIFQKWLQHPDYDNYWKSMVPTPAEYAKMDIPILCTTGYYDGAQVAAMRYVKLYFKNNKNPNLYLVIGPYSHFGAQRLQPDRVLMGYNIDSVANVGMRGLAYEWLDYILKNGKKPAFLEDKINYEVMGANQWKHVPSMEKMNNDTMTFYLTDLRNSKYYLLSQQKKVKQNFLQQIVDFKDRINQNNYFTPTILNDSLTTSNGITYITKPFDQSFSINGSFFGRLKASINKRDMDVSIAFYELMPDGKYFYLTRYLGRASYAKDNSRRQLLTPGKIETIEFTNVPMTSKQISKGSRLVIILNVNKHPFDEINYGSGKNVHDETIADAGEPLSIKWYTDSFIKVPVWKDKK
jgi:putative CocE/NonD family hydrolase